MSDTDTEITPLPASPNKDMLVLQVRAFLDAGEDVEIDVETVQDLMGAIVHSGDESVDNGLSVSIETEDEDDEQNNNQYSDTLAIEDELDISALYRIVDGVEHDFWTPQDIKQMMYHLKERGMASWVREYVVVQNVPIPHLLRAFGIDLCTELQNKRPSTLMYFLRVAMSRELRIRERLEQYNTISDAVKLIKSSRRMIILTGAGISVSCGIPDFRSRDGLYAQLKNRGEYELDDPQQMFDINYFRENPSVFYSFASQIYPSNFTPSPSHRFIKLVEDKGKLLRNYTQNIDTLETLAGVKKVLQCHGSFATASCLLCRTRVPGSEIEDDILRRKVPICKLCMPPTDTEDKKKRKKKGKKKASGKWDSEDEDESDTPTYPACIMKPDITFFGEKLSDVFDDALSEDRNRVDLLLVIGTSLKVSPVSEILSHLPHSIPQILINKTPVRHINPDIVLLGNADDIIGYLCHELEWQLPPPVAMATSTVASSRLYPARGGATTSSTVPAKPISVDRQEPRRIANSHVWMFEGGEGGKWVQDIERAHGVEGGMDATMTDPTPVHTPSPQPQPQLQPKPIARVAPSQPAAPVLVPPPSAVPTLTPEETARRAWKRARMH